LPKSSTASGQSLFQHPSRSLDFTSSMVCLLSSRLCCIISSIHWH
jgi:hypothetical protein